MGEEGDKDKERKRNIKKLYHNCNYRNQNGTNRTVEKVVRLKRLVHVWWY